MFSIEPARTPLSCTSVRAAPRRAHQTSLFRQERGQSQNARSPRRRPGWWLRASCQLVHTGDRLERWLASLPPFWAACLLTLTLNTSSAVLAFPTAVAAIGVLPGLALILLFGLCNTLTILCVIEALARGSTIYHGQTFIGKLIACYIGQIGTFLFTLSLGIGSFLALLSVYIGIATTLADLTGLPAVIWVVTVFLIGAVVLAHGSLKLPLGAMLLLGAAQILLLLALTAIALTHLHLQYILVTPLASNGQRLDMTRFGAFGVIYLAYTAQHKLITQVAGNILPRDPDARSLVRGTIAGTAGMILLWSIWVLGTGAAFAPSLLSTYSGTVLSLLHQQHGPLAGALGSLLLVISLGVGSLREASVLSQLVHDLLPQRSLSLSQQSSGRPGIVAHLGEILYNEKGRFLLSLSPLLCILACAEMLLVSGTQSFSHPFSIAGVITGPIFAGIIPVALLLASRRRGGQARATIYAFLGHPIFTSSLFLLFVGYLFIHGLSIWINPLERLCAFGAAALLIGTAPPLLRQRPFSKTHKGASGPATSSEHGPYC